MACDSNYLKLRGLRHVTDSDNSIQLENNFKLLFDWAYLGAGGWFDVHLDSVGAYGGNLSTLRQVTDPAFSDGQVWETFRKDWVWESAQTYTDKQGITTSPIQISGVYVNGVLATSGFHLDYPNGRVIFDTPKVGKTIQLEYSARTQQFLCASKTPWFNQLQFGSFRIDDGGFSIVGSGQWDILAQKRVQMPAAVIETVPLRSFRPYEIGNNALWSNQDIVFHILAETDWDRKNLTDALSKQEDKVFWLFDINKVQDSGAFPLDYNGSLINNITYQDLVSPSGYRWQKCFIKKSITQNITAVDPKLFRATVRWTVETIEGDI